MVYIFRQNSNSPLLEEYISGDFYRTPFIVQDKNIVDIFPVKGIKTYKENDSDFHWSDFEYDPCNKSVSKSAKDVAERLIRLFDLRDGSYVMEFIMNNSNELYLLEFSPRQTSSRISRLIELATGISAEKIAYKLFDNQMLNVDRMFEKTIRLRLESKAKNTPIEEEYILIESNSEKNIYGSDINCCYYERRKVNEK